MAAAAAAPPGAVALFDPELVLALEPVGLELAGPVVRLEELEAVALPVPLALDDELVVADLA